MPRGGKRPGAGRKPGGPKRVRVSYRLREETLERLGRANRTGETITDTLERLVRDGAKGGHMTIADILSLVATCRMEVEAGHHDDALVSLEALETGLREHEAFDRRVAEQIGEVCAAIAGAKGIPFSPPDLAAGDLIEPPNPCPSCSKGAWLNGSDGVCLTCGGTRKKSAPGPTVIEALDPGGLGVVGQVLPPKCSPETPCCERAGLYNRAHGGRRTLYCPLGCGCHD